MKTVTMAGILALGVIGGCYTSRAYPHASPLSKDDVVRLSQEGIADEVIISQIDATHSKFFLTVDEIIALRKAKVSQRVIDRMIGTSRHPGDQPAY
jgi:hypothetical protein